MLPSIRSRNARAEGPARGVLAAVLLGALLMAWAGPVQAADTEEAKRHFEKAEMAYKLGKYEEAIRGYEEAYRAMPEPAFLFNIAQAHRQQFRLSRKPYHLEKALSLYKNYLREMPKAPNRGTVRKLIDELKELLTAVEERHNDTNKGPAMLVLRGEIAGGATVTIDGKTAGTIPLSKKVEPGVHLVQVTKQGYAPWSTSITVDAGGKMDLPVMLQKRGGGGATPGPTPVYKKWWFWTIVGAVAVAGAGTGIYFATRGDDIPQMPTGRF